MSAKTLVFLSKSVQAADNRTIAEKRVAERKRRIALFMICVATLSCVCGAAVLYSL